jgi:hypothetical protein
MNRIEQMEKIQKTSLELFQKKQIDYEKTFKQYGMIGVLERIQAKIERSLINIANGENDETTIKDALLDLHNITAFGIILFDEYEH